MEYSAPIGTKHPGLFLILVDQSYSMQDPYGLQTKATVTATAVNNVINEIGMACLDGNKIRDRCFLGVVGYGASVKDKQVIDAYRFAQIAVGNEIFMDTYSIRNRSDWEIALPMAIQESDVFQLFWSEHSAKSNLVSKEWMYALELIRNNNREMSFIRPVYWTPSLIPNPPEELEHITFYHAPLSAKAEGTKLRDSQYINDQKQYIDTIISGLHQELELAIQYIESDPNGSLNKSRIICEKLLLDVYRREMRVDPKRSLIGPMLTEKAFVCKLDRRIHSWFNSIRDMGNLGTHGEYVESIDARRGVENLFIIIDWHKEKYQ